MELRPESTAFYLDRGFAKMLDQARRLGADVAAVPDLDGANSVFALVTHCMGMTEFWLAHVVCGDPTHRDRAAEFGATGSLAELEAAVADFVSGLPELLRRVEVAEFPATDLSASVPWPWGVDAVVVHVVEEVYQHLGHVDLTVDLLSRARGAGAD